MDARALDFETRKHARLVVKANRRTNAGLSEAYWRAVASLAAAGECVDCGRVVAHDMNGRDPGHTGYCVGTTTCLRRS